MAGSKTGAVLGTCLAAVTFITSLTVMGLSASIVAGDHESKIGIVHLVIVCNP